METLKQKIKTLAAQQIELKNQRKTVYIVGERKMTAGQAYTLHQSNRCILRELLAAYGLIKGRAMDQIESNPKEPINMTNVNKIILEYTQELTKVA